MISNIRNNIEELARTSVMGPEGADELMEMLKSNPELIQQISSASLRRSGRTPVLINGLVDIALF